MSRRDELAVVLAQHRWRSDHRCTCGWSPDPTIPQFPDPPRVPTIVQFEKHQADAIISAATDARAAVSQGYGEDA